MLTWQNQKIAGGKQMFKRMALLVLLFFMVCSSAMALTDREYKAMLQTSSEFRQADAELTRAWKRVYGLLNGREKRDLLENQRQWVKTGRDAAARKMRGMGRAEAYAAVSRARAEYLDSYASSEQDASDRKAGSGKRPGVTPLSANCGVVRARIPIDDQVSQVLVDSGQGILRSYYYLPVDNGVLGSTCNNIKGVMCFKVLQEMPVTRKLRESGVQDSMMTFIHDCTVGK